jgi:teichoic acid transport system permease protein
MFSEFVQLIKDHFLWRNQIIKLAGSDLRKTYSGSALGWSWALIRPSVTIFVFWFAFSVGLRVKLGPEGFSFFQWLLAGMIAWFYVSDIWAGGADAMRKYRYLITKMKFPVPTIPTFVSLAKIFIHIMLFLVVLVIFAFGGHYPDVYYLQLPVLVLLMFLMGTGWAFFASVMASMSKDFLNLVKTFSQAIFWLSGIMWDPKAPELIHIEWLQNILLFNPVTFVVTAYRDSLIYKIWIFEEPLPLVIFLTETVLIWCLALWVYKKAKHELPDVL